MAVVVVEEAAVAVAVTSVEWVECHTAALAVECHAAALMAECHVAAWARAARRVGAVLMGIGTAIGTAITAMAETGMAIIGTAITGTMGIITATM